MQAQLTQSMADKILVELILEGCELEALSDAGIKAGFTDASDVIQAILNEELDRIATKQRNSELSMWAEVN